MKPVPLLFSLLLLIFTASVCLRIGAVETGYAEKIRRPRSLAASFRDTDLSESIATLKLQGGTEVAKVFHSLLARARTSPECRTQVVQAVITAMDQATHGSANQQQAYFLWDN